MKNRLFYLIGVAALLSYTGTFTSCVNGVDDEYLEQQLLGDSEGSGETEEIPDINGKYGQGGDFDLKLMCNGEELTGKTVSLEANEGNETATITLSGAEVDLETMIAGALPGGVGGLVTGLGLKYTSNSPVPGEKEITIPNVTLYKNGTAYRFDGETILPKCTIAYKGIIDGDNMSMDINYKLSNQTLAGTWNVSQPVGGTSVQFAPMWCDWDSKVVVSLGKYIVALDKYPFNELYTILTGALSPILVKALTGKAVGVQPLICNMLRDITTEPNGCIFASYSYGEDFTKPGPYSQDMPHNALRYYYDSENPEQRIYLEVNADFLIKLFGGVTRSISPRVDYDKTKDIAKRLFKLLVPVLKEGIPCEYKIEGNNLTVNIDGVVLRDILRVLMELLNDETIKGEVENILNDAAADFKPNIMEMLRTMPNALQYHDYDAATDTYSGECQYVKLGFRFVKK